MKDLSIIIVNWNTEKYLNQCIESVYKETKKLNLEIIVVDNYSSDGSTEMIKKNFPEVLLIENKINRGFSAANNQGLKIADAKAILLLNPDTIITDNAIEKMFYRLESSDCDILTCKLLNEDYTLQKSVNSFYSFWSTLIENRFTDILFEKFASKNNLLKKYWDHNKSIQIDWARGAVLMMKKETFKKLGYLDERFFVYGEEIDYYYRAKKENMKSFFLSNAEIVHIGKCSSRQNKANMFIQNYRSFYQFLKKHYSLFSYLLFKTRTWCLLTMWCVYYGVLRIAKKDQNQFQVYSKTLLWHLSFERIK